MTASRAHGPKDDRPEGRPGPRRVSDDSREALRADAVKRYSQGETVRTIADALGHSYSFVHRLLADAGTEFRRRGGSVRKSVS